MYQPASTLPAFHSNTLIITSDSTFKSKTAYVAHSSAEARMTFVGREDEVKEIIIDLTADGTVGDSIVQYFKLRAQLGMPLVNKTFTLQGTCPEATDVKNELVALGYVVNN